MSDFSSAAAAWNRDHPGDWPRMPGRCPACAVPGHGEGCFGRLGDDADRWACLAAGHGDRAPDCGRPGNGAWWGDALDLEAHARRVSRADVLRADGYLTGAPRTAAPTRPAQKRPPTREELLAARWAALAPLDSPAALAHPTWWTVTGADPATATRLDLARRDGAAVLLRAWTTRGVLGDLVPFDAAPPPGRLLADAAGRALLLRQGTPATVLVVPPLDWPRAAVQGEGSGRATLAGECRALAASLPGDLPVLAAPDCCPVLAELLPGRVKEVPCSR